MLLSDARFNKKMTRDNKKFRKFGVILDKGVPKKTEWYALENIVIASHRF